MSDNSEVTSYGVRKQTSSCSLVEKNHQQVRRNGFSILDSGFSQHEIDTISQEFNKTCETYQSKHTTGALKDLGELDIVRMPMFISPDSMLKVALNSRLLEVVDSLIDGTFVLNQQNLITNPSKQNYSQSAWHRDLPYQHFTSSSPLAVNAIYCVDDFTSENGASYVIPGSHLHSEFPSDEFVSDSGVQLAAKAGSYIVVDCMAFHRGGYNRTTLPRRAINHVFNIPYFKQQIAVDKNIDTSLLSDTAKSVLGIGASEPRTVEEYLVSRARKQD